MRLSYVAIAVACAFCPSAAAAQTSPPPAPAASAAAPSDASSTGVPTADPAITARAKDWLHRVQTGTIDRAQLNAQMDSAFSDALVKQTAAQFGPLGDPTDFSLVDTRSVAGNVAYMYKATFKSGAVYWVFALDQTGKISGLHFLPAH